MYLLAIKTFHKQPGQREKEFYHIKRTHHTDLALKIRIINYISFIMKKFRYIKHEQRKLQVQQGVKMVNI